MGGNGFRDKPQCTNRSGFLTELGEDSPLEPNVSEKRLPSWRRVSAVRSPDCRGVRRQEVLQVGSCPATERMGLATCTEGAGAE